MKPIFFATPADLRAWFNTLHESETELLLGFYKKDSGKPSVTWPEAVDEALCVGWIDKIRKRLDDESYTVRFTPRKPRSIWSAVNIARVEALTKEGRMQPEGLQAFEQRDQIELTEAETKASRLIKWHGTSFSPSLVLTVKLFCGGLLAPKRTKRERNVWRRLLMTQPMGDQSNNSPTPKKQSSYSSNPALIKIPAKLLAQK